MKQLAKFQVNISLLDEKLIQICCNIIDSLKRTKNYDVITLNA